MPRTSEIQPGDLILVTRREDDPLAMFVSEMDGSIWSHCGIAVSDGRVANCRTGPDAYDVGDPGGIRLDEIDVFLQAKRSVHRARPRLDNDVLARAVRFAESFGKDGRSGAQQSEFGFAKLFLVSCALAGVRPALDISHHGRRSIVHAAVDAARILSWTRSRPLFFCSEFVSAAYGEPFAEKDLTPPVVIDIDQRKEPTVPERVEGFLDRVNAEIGGTQGAAALLRLVAVMGLYQASYLVKALDTTLKWKEFEEQQQRRSDDALPASDSDLPPVVEVPTLPLDALPQALVTPRMLAHASWMGDAELIASPEDT